MKQLYFKTREEWREWFSHNHDRQSGIWLLFYRKGSEKPVLNYEESVEEALCYGWIDSIIKNLDQERYARKFTPRQPDSTWSDLNKKRVQKMIEQGRMTRFGQSKIDAARQSGQWDKPDRPPVNLELPLELKKALEKNYKAKAFFERLAPSYQKNYIAWIRMARRPGTRERRTKESIALLEKGEKLGLK